MAYQRGTGFVGLQQYLNANQEAAEKMGQGLAQQVNAEGGAAQGAIDQAGQEFNQQATTGTPVYDTATAMLEPGALGEAARQGQITYKGPTSLGGTEALAKQAAGAQQTATLAGTDAGRATLLAKGAQGQYGLGARTLDSYLAGRGGGEALQQATSKYSKLQDYLGTAKTAAEARAGQGVADAAALSDRYKAEFPVAAAPAAVAPPEDTSLRDAAVKRGMGLLTTGRMHGQTNRLAGIPLGKKKRGP